MGKHSLVLVSNRNEIRKFETLLTEINESFAMPMEKFINFQIASSEALVNAIVHGNKEDESKKVYIDIITTDTSMELRIKDEGEGFEMEKLPDPTDDSNLLKEHGRGIFIIRSLVDEFHIESDKTGTRMVLLMAK